MSEIYLITNDILSELFYYYFEKNIKLSLKIYLQSQNAEK